MPRYFVYFTLIALLLQGCGSGLLSVHKVDVQQGNKIDNAQVEQLREGMTRRQVRFLLGEPVHRDPFQGERRWDYVYYVKPGDQAATQQRLTVHFEGDILTRIDR